LKRRPATLSGLPGVGSRSACQPWSRQHALAEPSWRYPFDLHGPGQDLGGFRRHADVWRQANPVRGVDRTQTAAVSRAGGGRRWSGHPSGVAACEGATSLPSPRGGDSQVRLSFTSAGVVSSKVMTGDVCSRAAVRCGGLVACVRKFAVAVAVAGLPLWRGWLLI